MPSRNSLGSAGQWTGYCQPDRRHSCSCGLRPSGTEGFSSRLAHVDWGTDVPRVLVHVLIGLSGVFYLLWGSDVVRSLLSRTAPQSAVDVGFPVNPVHVMDLALLLPGMALTGLLLRRRRPLGYFLAAPFLVCVITIGLAVMGMVAVMMLRGFPPAYPARSQ